MIRDLWKTYRHSLPCGLHIYISIIKPIYLPLKAQQDQPVSETRFAIFQHKSSAKLLTNPKNRKNCLNFGKVISGNGVGYGIGKEDGGVLNCYYDSTVCGTAKGYGTGLTTAVLCNGNLPTDFDDTIWNAGSSDSVVGRLKTGANTYPSLKGVGKAVTAGVVTPKYDFSIAADGTTYDDFIPITTAEEFLAIGKTDDSRYKYYVLMNNIDLKGEEIDPICEQFDSFMGRFSGDGHTISNFKINKSSEDYIGLFGYNSGLIMNLAVKGGNVTGDRYVGGICGHNEGRIYACSFDGTVSGSTSIGGICGRNYTDDGIISNCFNSGDIIGNDDVGGICGLECAGAVSYSISVGTIQSSGYYVGGVVGETQGSAAVGYCYYDYEVGKVDNNYAIGGTENNDNAKVGALTTTALCSDVTELSPFTNSSGSVWDYGNIPNSDSDVVVNEDNDRFGKKTYTYIHLIDIGTPKSIDVDVYNFDYSGNFPEWKTYVLLTQRQISIKLMATRTIISSS